MSSTVTAHSPSHTADDLSFTKRDEWGGLVFWTTPPVDSEHWDDHYKQGKTAGEEYLNYILSTTEVTEDGEEWSLSLSRVIYEIMTEERKVNADGISIGFLDAIQIYLRTGRVSG